MPLSSHANPWHTMDKISEGKGYMHAHVNTAHTWGHGLQAWGPRSSYAPSSRQQCCCQLAAATVSQGPSSASSIGTSAGAQLLAVKHPHSSHPLPAPPPTCSP